MACVKILLLWPVCVFIRVARCVVGVGCGGRLRARVDVVHGFLGDVVVWDVRFRGRGIFRLGFVSETFSAVSGLHFLALLVHVVCSGVFDGGYVVAVLQ